MEQVIKRLERLIKILRLNPNYKLDEVDISDIEKLIKAYKIKEQEVFNIKNIK